MERIFSQQTEHAPCQSRLEIVLLTGQSNVRQPDVLSSGWTFFRTRRTLPDRKGHVLTHKESTPGWHPASLNCTDQYTLPINANELHVQSECMMAESFWNLEPEVACELGEGSDVDTSVHPPSVSSLEVRFVGWLGDELLETFPCYVVTDSLARDLASAKLTGFELDRLSVVTSDEFDEIYRGPPLPEFRWLKVTGRAGLDDFGLSERHTLVVSERAFHALRQHTLIHCLIQQRGRSV